MSDVLLQSILKELRQLRADLAALRADNQVEVGAIHSEDVHRWQCVEHPSADGDSPMLRCTNPGGWQACGEKRCTTAQRLFVIGCEIPSREALAANKERLKALICAAPSDQLPPGLE